METGDALIFVGLIVGSCIIGGAAYSGLKLIADAIRQARRAER